MHICPLWRETHDRQTNASQWNLLDLLGEPAAGTHTHTYIHIHYEHNGRRTVYNTPLKSCNYVLRKTDLTEKKKKKNCVQGRNDSRVTWLTERTPSQVTREPVWSGVSSRQTKRFKRTHLSSDTQWTRTCFYDWLLPPSVQRLELSVSLKSYWQVMIWNEYNHWHEHITIMWQVMKLLVIWLVFYCSWRTKPSPKMLFILSAIDLGIHFVLGGNLPLRRTFQPHTYLLIIRYLCNSLVMNL